MSSGIVRYYSGVAHPLDNVLTLTEASALTGLSTPWLRRLVISGRLPAKKMGKTWLVLREDMERLAGQERRRGPQPGHK